MQAPAIISVTQAASSKLQKNNLLALKSAIREGLDSRASEKNVEEIWTVAEKRQKV